jgi:ABC-type sugar transport system permease subunit
MSVPTASRVATERAPARRRKHAPGHGARMRFVVLALTPIMLLFFIFSFLPIGVSIFLSFYRYSPLDMNAPFIGLRNYTFAFSKDPAFTASLWNTLKYVLIAVPLNIVLTLPIALALNRIKRFKAFFRAVYFMPAIASLVAVVLIWRYLLDPEAGLINGALALFGIPGRAWLGEPEYALYAMILLSVWQDMGYNVIVFLAGLQTIPDTFYEAAMVDGANGWQRFRHITLPLLSRTTLFVFVLTTISYMQVFVPMEVMTRGGPLNSTRTIVLHIWDQAFQYLKMGYASALSVVLLLMLLAITLIQLRLLRTNWEY